MSQAAIPGNPTPRRAGGLGFFSYHPSSSLSVSGESSQSQITSIACPSDGFGISYRWRLVTILILIFCFHQRAPQRHITPKLAQVHSNFL
jgi:uncharacterized membrane protein